MVEHMKESSQSSGTPLPEGVLKKRVPARLGSLWFFANNLVWSLLGAFLAYWCFVLVRVLEDGVGTWAYWILIAFLCIVAYWGGRRKLTPVGKVIIGTCVGFLLGNYGENIGLACSPIATALLLTYVPYFKAR